MSAVDILSLLGGDLAVWIVIGVVLSYITLFFLWEIYAPKVFGRETVLSPIIHDVPEKVDALADEQSELRQDVNHVEQEVSEVKAQQEKLTNVTVAQSHMMNGYEGDMDVHQVENDLLEDESTPRSYLEDDVEDHHE